MGILPTQYFLTLDCQVNDGLSNTMMVTPAQMKRPAQTLLPTTILKGRGLSDRSWNLAPTTLICAVVVPHSQIGNSHPRAVHILDQESANVAISCHRPCHPPYSPGILLGDLIRSRLWTIPFKVLDPMAVRVFVNVSSRSSLSSLHARSVSFCCTSQ